MARKLIVEIIGDSTSYQRALAKSEQGSRRFGEAMKSSGKAVAVTGLKIAAVGAVIGTVASREFSKFEDSMNKIVGLVGVSRKQVDAWSEDLLAMSTEVAKSPTELADAMFFVTSAGLRGQKALDALNVSAHASAAGMGETKTVADALTSAINAYGAANITAAQAGDILVATVREGKTAADAVAPSLGVILPIAAELGVSFDQVGASIAGMTRSGTSAMKASTALRSVFNTLLKPQKKSIDAFKGVGLNIDSLREMLAKPNGLLKVLTLVRKRFAGNTTEMARAFPNTKALTAVLQLVGKSGDQVRKIFERMQKTTGSVNKAFGAISKDEGFQFERTLQALRVAGIRLGAILEPLANLLARGLTAAFKKVGDFFKRFHEAQTLKGKLNVVWEGVEGIAKAAQRTLKRALGAIDWKAVFTSARGMADALQGRLEKVNWEFIGKRIGDSIAKATKFIIPAAGNLAGRLTKAFETIDWEKLGVAMGPGLVTALLSAFDALLDPAFWARNWQLALAVGIDALGLVFPETFGIKKLAGIFLKPFSRLGARLAGPLAARLAAMFSDMFATAGSALITGADKLSGRLASSLGHDLIMLPRLLSGILDRSFGELGRRIAAKFKSLGLLARFTIRLLGIAAVIRTIERFVTNVAHLFGRLARTVRDAWNRMFTWLEKKALQAALKIIEPFTHIPKILGGGSFQGLKTKWKAALANMETDAADSARRMAASLGQEITVPINITVRPLRESGSPTDRVTRPRRTGTTTEDAAQTTAAERAKAAAEARRRAAATAKKAADKAKTAYENLIDALTLKLDMATAKRGFKDDLAALNAIHQAILDRIKVVGKTTDLSRQLFENTQQLKQATADALKAAQFKALGLTAEGQKPVASTAALLHRAKGMLNLIKGTVLDTKKNRQQLHKIIAVLKANFKKAGNDVRQAILDMLNTIAGTGDSTQANRALTKTQGLNTRKILEGLGLSPEEERALRARLSHFNTAGKALAGSGSRSGGGVFVDDRPPLIVHTTVNIDGKKVANNTTRHQQKDRRRNPRQKRGPNRTHGI